MTWTRHLPARSPDTGGFQRCALVVGHPGHELKVFGWMSQYRPRVYVITDGSGRSGNSRIGATATVVDRLGATRGEIFGAVSDARMYQAILQQDLPCFLRLIDELADSFSRHGVDCVAGDAAEGFNPTHDLCRVVINAAVLLAERESGRPIANLEFQLADTDSDCPPAAHDERCQHFCLNDALLAEKIATARAYAGLEEAVRETIAAHDENHFRLECLRPAADPALPDAAGGKLFYEIHGEQRVASGQYGTVIRQHEHVMPLADAIVRHAGEGYRARRVAD
jgi:hypothetical protein